MLRLGPVDALIIAGPRGVDRLGPVDDDVGIGVLGEIVDQVIVRQISLMPKCLRSAIAVADDHTDAASDVKVVRHEHILVCGSASMIIIIRIRMKQSV